MLFYLAIVSGLFLSHQTRVTTAVPATICTTEPEKAPITTKRLGESFQFICPLPCAGDHVFEHYNQQAEHLSKIQEDSSYEAIIPIANHNDAGIYRCWCRENEDPSYCHHKVQVTSPQVDPRPVVPDVIASSGDSSHNSAPPTHTNNTTCTSDNCNITMTPVNRTIMNITLHNCSDPTIQLNITEMQIMASEAFLNTESGISSGRTTSSTPLLTTAIATILMICSY